MESSPPLPAAPPAAPEPPTTRRPPPWGLATWAAAVLYFAAHFHRRWIPLDEGTLAQPALRVLRGELPHRDFDAVYSGLLELVHAAAMAAFGVHLLAPRLVLLAAVALWVPALWAVARRLVGLPAAASALVLLAVVLGPPNYPAAMPSWYNLFFGTWALWALVRWSESGRGAWLVAAGAFGGISVLMKVSGVFCVAAVLFFVLQRTVEEAPAAAGATTGRGGATAAAAAGAVAARVGLELLLVRSQAGLPAWTNFVLPTLALGVVLAGRAWRLRPGPERLASWVRRWALVGAGVLLPVAPFVLAYAAAGALDDLWRGVVTLPGVRLERVASAPPPLAATAGILVPLAVVGLEPFAPRRLRRALAVATAGLGAVLLVFGDPGLFALAFRSLVLLVPVACVAGAVVLAGQPAFPQRDALVATLWTAALLHLIRFPFDVPIYFGYVAPVGVLAAGGVVAAARREPGGLSLRRAPATAALAAVLLAFMVVGPNRQGLFGPLPPQPTVPLPMERGRLEVPLGDAREYAALVEAVRERSRGEYIYATPDAPEVYFLAGRRNPTRTLFEVFEDDATRTAETLRALESRGVDVVVINTRPRYSGLPRDLAEALRARYPHGAAVGRFLVWWRGPLPAEGGSPTPPGG